MKNINPRESSCLNRTIRADGIPAGVAVERVIASGSFTLSFCDTSVNQIRNWSRGEGAAVVGLTKSEV